MSTVPKPSLFGDLRFLGDLLFNGIFKRKRQKKKKCDDKRTYPCPFNPATQSEANAGKPALWHTWRLQEGHSRAKILHLPLTVEWQNTKFNKTFYMFELRKCFFLAKPKMDLCSFKTCLYYKDFGCKKLSLGCWRYQIFQIYTIIKICDAIFQNSQLKYLLFK